MKHALIFVATVSLVAFSACSQPNDHAQHETTEAAHSNHTTHQADAISPKSEDAGMTLSNVRVQPPFPGRDVAAGFFTLSNGGPADRLINAASNISEITEIHTHLSEDGIMKMRRIEGIDIGEGETLVFKPGGYHLMMFGANIAPETTETVLTLEFEKAGPITVNAPVRDITDEDNDRPEDHSNH